MKIGFHKLPMPALQPVVQMFNKADLPVSSATGEEKGKRTNGILTKQAKIQFKSGQVLVLFIKDDGGVFQFRLNGKVLAIKNYRILDEALKEVIELVRLNERAYLKQKEVTALKNHRVTVPKLPTATLTIQVQIESYKNKLSELDAEADVIKQHHRDMDSILAEKRGRLTLLERQIASENERSKTLEAQLEEAKKTAVILSTRGKGIFESASTTDPVSISSLAGFGKSGPAQRFVIEIDGDFNEPAEYRGLIQAIEAAREIDRINLRINSNGGDTQSAQAFYSALLKTPARTKAIIINAYSSGSIVAMACDSIELTPFCSMMVGNVAGGTGGKLGDMAGYATFKAGYFSEWYGQLYAGFLTEGELKDVAKGQEFWMKEEQIRERLKNWKPIRDRIRRDGTVVAA